MSNVSYSIDCLYDARYTVLFEILPYKSCFDLFSIRLTIYTSKTFSFSLQQAFFSLLFSRGKHIQGKHKFAD